MQPMEAPPPPSLTCVESVDRGRRVPLHTDSPGALLLKPASDSSYGPTA